MSVLHNHHQNPKKESVRLILAYKNFAALKGISHIGLGVTARNNQAVLRREGYKVEVWPLVKDGDFIEQVNCVQEDSHRTGQLPITHIVVSAPWLKSETLGMLARKYPEVMFVVTSHSNIAFLQYDKGGINLLKKNYQMGIGITNFRAGGNNSRYTNWVSSTFESPCLHLPNLYDLLAATPHPYKQAWNGGILRIGCFGATRPLKNCITACAAAMQVAKRLNCDTEFWISQGRDEPSHGIINTALNNLAAGFPRFKLVVNHWQGWPAFRQTVGSMSLLMQPSFSETFNVVTADGIAQGISSVVSPTIDWVPKNWVADPDDVNNIADVAIGILHDNHAAQNGLKSLQRYITEGVHAWDKFLLTKV